MSEILGKKRFVIDQPAPKARTSIAGSGIMILIGGTQLGNPTLNISLIQATTQINSSPTFNAPTIAWT